MDRFLAVYKSDLSLSEKEDAIHNTIDETYICDMSEEDYFNLVKFCMCETSKPHDQKRDNALVVVLMAKLQKSRMSEFNDISMLVVSDLISTGKHLHPHNTIVAVKELIIIDYLDDVVSTEFSESVLEILQALHGKMNLSALVDIANLCQVNQKCLPPPQQHYKFCTELINQICSLNIPQQPLFFKFMQDCITVAAAVQKIWLISSEDVVLPCLSYIYSLIASSSFENPPSCTLAAFLNITPSSEIDTALQKLLAFPVMQGNSHVIKLAASTFCDWLWIWPKASRVSHWLISLLRMLSTSNNSHIVAEVIDDKFQKIMSQSVVPVIRNSTGPVLLYMLLAVRDQRADKLDPIIEAALELFGKIKSQIQNPDQTFKLDLVEVLFHLIAKRPPSDRINQLVLKALVDYSFPSNKRLQSRIASVPSLFDDQISREWSERMTPINWLEARSSTGKIGLINLGNTCYVNSILQALLMNQDFTCAVMAAKPMPHQVVLTKLQQVLIFLKYSFRSAYSPAAFIKLSRPPWFEAGRQQDCSEFLRYLMDSLFEQERAGRSVLLCDQRWTVAVDEERKINLGNSHKEDVDNDDELEELPGLGAETLALQRWVTEEDLRAAQLHLLSGKDEKTVLEPASATDGLSNVHSESTDSGIQSVGDGQEEKEKVASISSPREENSQGSVEENIQRSLIHQIFGGKMTTTYRCFNCGTESHHQDFFTDLHLAFPDPTTHLSPLLKSSRQSPRLVLTDDTSLSLNSLLESYFAPEKLQGDNRYHCDRCADLVLEAERVLRITEAPQHLLLTLLRFHYDKVHQRRNKITTKVNYPRRLDLPVSGSIVSYLLYSVVIHSGLTLDGGHYYTLGKSSDSTTDDPDAWFMFNDSVVSRTDFDSLINLSRKYPTDTPYLLWYKREEAVQNHQTLPLLLPADLKQLVDQDNQNFIRERLVSTNSRPPRIPWPSNKKDDDDDPPDLPREDRFCDNVGPRFIF